MGNPIFDRGQNLLEKAQNFQIISGFNYESTVIFLRTIWISHMGDFEGSFLLNQKLEIREGAKTRSSVLYFFYGVIEPEWTWVFFTGNHKHIDSSTKKIFKIYWQEFKHEVMNGLDIWLKFIRLIKKSK